MFWVTRTFVLFFLYLHSCDGGYGIPAQSGSQDPQSDVEAPAYVPAYAKNQHFTKTGHSRGYGGTKTGYSGTKTGYAGTKTGYAGTKNGYGSPSRYTNDRSWYSESGEAPNYREFYSNANQPYKQKCEPECRNSGICVDTNTCLCPSNFQGKFCEFEKKPCLTYPPMPMNSRRKCSSEQCTITCMEGHKFIDGSTVANMRCADGRWQPSRADFTSIPDCEPECSPPCLNGGVCLAVNTCNCPAEYRGPQCQYATSICDIRKLAFNGGYKCFGDGEKFSCILSCPAGATYSSPPADVYTCHYATGVYQPQPIPHCVFTDVIVITPNNYHHNSTYYGYHTESSSEGSMIHVQEPVSSNLGYQVHHETGNPVQVIVQDLTPKGGTCLSWAGVHYKTFDGVIYSFQSQCQHILVREPTEHKYTVAIKHGECERQAYCPSEITVYLEDKAYVIAAGDDGSVVFRSTKRLIPIPASLPGIRVSMPRDHVVVNLDSAGVTIKWDTNNLILIEGSILLWNNTEGLCGKLDGNPSNDLTTKEGQSAKTKTVMASSWQINKIGDVCDSNPTETSACASKSDDDMKKALQFCTKVFSKEKFRKCSKVMDVSLLLEACQWDYCACKTALTSEECACSTVSVYAKECLRHGIEEMKNWRDADTCPMKCPEGKLYQSCGADVQPSCAFPQAPIRADNSTCVEGCFCPDGLLLDGGRCIPKNECPCRLRNKSFKPGKVLTKDCNTCTCQAGEWTCTQVPCGARCGAVGDPHYTTFDGLRYDFMGHCTYTMLQADNVTVQVENIACSGAITEEMNLSPYNGEGKPSCTKAVSLTYNGMNIHLKQGGFILVNGKEVSVLPLVVGESGVRIRAASSLFLIVQLPNKVDLWWDGNTRVFVDVPAEFHGKTSGLCGTFNQNQKDDFLTPENDVEQSALAFANKWKTREFCSDVDTKEPEHPCKAHVENKEAAEKYCSKLKSKLFEECHWYVDVEAYYSACLYDMCACAGDVSRCLCPVLGDYAMSCAKAGAGVLVQWRYFVKECELSCTGGQEYTVCADSCLRKCSDTALAASGLCKPSCVEGCACPIGQLLDDNGVCVPVGLCPCFHKGLQFNAGYKEVRAGRREKEICTCVGARWDCLPATPEDIQNYPPAEDLRSNCSATNNMEFTTCEIAEPLTCKNMHLPPSSTTEECRPGCQCKKGYVLDTVSKKCVLATECPCHHGGRSYPDGHEMQEECNKCQCKSGNWSCTKRKCAGVCGAWGDSHMTTFDGTEYDFEGVCTYLLAKGVMDGSDGFDVEIQNVPCGTTGATCSKSMTLKVGGGGNEEIVSLTKNAPIPDISKLKRIKLRLAGAYVFLDVPSLGMSVQWDRGMRVYVKVDSMWQGRVKGLCGNYNGDMRDDFQTPSGGGLAESSALIFADSWKLKSTCPKPQPAIEHCKQRPERRQWAAAACGALKRFPFTLCHAEVPAGAHAARCERDACACDAGADCECACAALAAYAHACALRGVTFKWRTQDMCPMQCDEECSNYDECVSACPLESCDNTLYYSEITPNCEQDTCVEGCKPKKSCPEGTVYKNSSTTECVPRAKCKPVCMTLEDGREVLEGEVMEEDACHTCRCSKKHKVCTGQPCSTEAPVIGSSTEATSPKPHDEPLKCVTGWTPWVNRGAPETGPDGDSIDNEPLPRPNELQIGSPMCKQTMMTRIECRTTTDHRTPKETGLDVECSLERGLVCKEHGKACPDFEIRVYCECEEPSMCVNSVRPNEPHPTDCTKFYECTPSGPILKDCGPGTMYNPQLMVCDWPAAVAAIRPECARTGVTESSPAVSESSTPSAVETPAVCPPGQVHSKCAYPCDKLCDYFKRTLMDQGKCITEKCVEGCVEKSVANIKCDFGSMWRDEKTCVPLKDCTCFSDDKIVKPGGVVVDGCLKCQCLDNNFHCDSSECISIDIPETGSTHLPFMIPRTVHPPIMPSTLEEITVSTPIPSSAGTAPTAGTSPTVPTALTSPTISSVTPPIIVKNTATPPPECAPDSYIDLMWGDEPLPQSAFSASSTASAIFGPQYAVLNGHPLDITAGSWNPSTSDNNPYIQVELPRREPIYGVVMQGSPLFDEYVTSYEVMYGDDGTTFSTVDGPDGKPRMFRGPTDNSKPLKQMIEPPIEAKFVRVHPLTWHENIAVRLELIGCQEAVETTTETTSEASPLCKEPLGIAADLPIENIEVSSNNDARKYFALDGERGWRPLYSTPGEWIMFNFTSPRNITGVKTKGGVNGWVTTYNILYTSDLNTFNPVVDREGVKRVFPANFDSDSTVLNEFRPPIHAQYFKVLPVSWSKNIEMRIEPIGCFEPYPVTEVVVEATTAGACALCPGVAAPRGGCACASPAQHYDGENCVTRDQCPCLESYMSYPVGSTFRGANCDECVCKLGGITDCKPVKECQCAPNLVPKLSPSNCDCVCSPCSNGTKICPTSKLCLPLEMWCNGVQDCPDDELDCQVSRVPITEPVVVTTVAPTAAATAPTTTTTAATPLICPKVECSPGYIVHYTSTTRPSESWSLTSDLPPPRPKYSYQRYQKGGYTKGGYRKGGYTKTGYTKTGFSKGGYGLPPPPQPNQAFTLDKPTVNANPSAVKQECQQFKCIPKLPPFPKAGSTLPPPVCSVTICPEGYTLKLDKSSLDLKHLCPQYECVPPPERPVYCNVTGRTFTTFDGAEYKYDVCFHVLARENRFSAWAVFVRKKCSEDGCVNELLVSQDDQAILVKPTMMIEYANYEYTVEQTSKICFQKNSFDVDRLGDGISIKSRKYNFTVLYNKNGDIKIGVSKKYMGGVDGMCGAFDGSPANDRRLPDGRLATTVDQFGRAWARPGLTPAACEAKVVPPAEQKRVWNTCADITSKEPLSKCSSVLNMDKWRSICLEKVTACAALANSSDAGEEMCRCQLLDQLVAECLAADRDLDISGWRMALNCPAECPAPLVHYDCYRKRCEPTCSTLGSVTHSCPAEEGQCFPGCYCPEGKLRKGDQCLLPADCLDCTCNGAGTPAKYVTFEDDDLPFLGNCTYLASRDRNETGQHKYQVYSTNGPCEDNAASVCTKIVHLMYEKNVIHITKDSDTKKLVTTVGNTPVFKYPQKLDWVTISLDKGQDVSVVLPDIHVELTVLQNKMEFSVRVPSSVYGNQTEGLCGVCAGYQDFLVTSNGTATEDFEEYGKSWQATPETLTALEVPPQAQCDQPPLVEQCVPPPPESNPCYNLYNGDRFGECHALVEPQPFVESCSVEACGDASAACAALERYAAACRRQGVCLRDWRAGLCPYPCDQPLVYRACVDCERTCENNDELSTNPEKCDKQPVEGCFCPEGKVRVNNTCIEPTKCFPCDANKEHYAGDEWQENACTKCTCSKLTGENAAHVSCTTLSCTTPVCSQDEDLVTKPAAQGQCCPEYMCVPKPKAIHCVEPKKMECGFGQVLKQKTTADGCTEFACECMPESECERVPSDAEAGPLEAGVERAVDRSGCCPRAALVCRPAACPRPPPCPPHRTLATANVTGKCCPEFSCELPKDKCVVTLEWEAAAKGGEQARTTPQVVLKDLESVWLDGPCRSCRCGGAAGAATARCAVAECGAVLSTDSAVLEPRAVPFACCPVPVYVACRDGDNIYKVGENWTSPDDVCTRYRCVETEDNKLERLTTVQHCDTDCQPGWRYEAAAAGGGQCCGRCAAAACVAAGAERPAGARWTSDDFCTNYTCVDLNGTLQVQSSNETCPEVSDAVKKQFVLKEEKVPGKCCRTHEAVACRVDNKIYQEGQSWASPDPCVNVTCSRDVAGRLTHAESVQSCVRDCKRGWVYAAPARAECCGRCVQDSCVLEDRLRKPGTTWQSADNCTTYSCERAGEEVFVTSSRQACPDVSRCAPEDIVNQTCCLICDEKPQSLSKCVPKSMPSKDTVGLFRTRLRPHGLCVNEQPVKGFKECRGACDSGAIYDTHSSRHESQCECCSAAQFAQVEVTLRCEDGSQQPHRVASPSRCSCSPCGAPSKSPWSTKSGYTAVKSPLVNPHPSAREEELNDVIPDIYQRFADHAEKPRLK